MSSISGFSNTNAYGPIPDELMPGAENRAEGIKRAIIEHAEPAESDTSLVDQAVAVMEAFNRRARQQDADAVKKDLGDGSAAIRPFDWGKYR